MTSDAARGTAADALLESAQPDPGAAPPLSAAVLATAADGLEAHPGTRKDVVVVGAGLAGLVAAHELARQGHRPIVLEAQNRVGGRVYTLRSFAPGLYAEAGAMRIPRAHDLTLAYCRRALLPPSRLDPGRAGVGHPCRARDPRGATAGVDLTAHRI